MTPKQVAARLGISTAMLRRHVATYEGIYGELKRDGRGREYSPEVLERLQAALAAHHAGRTASVQEALETMAKNHDVEAATRAAPEEIGEVEEVEEVGEVRDVGEVGESGTLDLLRHLVAEVAALRAEVANLKAPPSHERAEEIEELRHRNEYLHRELERRDKARGHRERRPWWRRWGGS